MNSFKNENGPTRYYPRKWLYGQDKQLKTFLFAVYYEYTPIRSVLQSEYFKYNKISVRSKADLNRFTEANSSDVNFRPFHGSITRTEKKCCPNYVHCLPLLLKMGVMSPSSCGSAAHVSVQCNSIRQTEYLESGGQVDVMYSDFEKAFDKIPHKRLISKLISCGFNSTLINWIQDFLQSRKFRVRVNSSFSLWDAVTSGIPQGSVLGPLLYIIYINDLVECCETVKYICLLHDDVKLFRHIVSPNDHCLLQKGIDALQHWSQQWLLKLNISKCNIQGGPKNRTVFRSL